MNTNKSKNPKKIVNNDTSPKSSLDKKSSKGPENTISLVSSCGPLNETEAQQVRVFKNHTPSKKKRNRFEGPEQTSLQRLINQDEMPIYIQPMQAPTELIRTPTFQETFPDGSPLNNGAINFSVAFNSPSPKYTLNLFAVPDPTPVEEDGKKDVQKEEGEREPEAEESEKSLPEKEKEQEKENDKDKEKEKVIVPPECTLCVTKFANVVLLPCGHGGLCEGCLLKAYSKSTECYMCKAFIEKAVRIDPTRQVGDMVIVVGEVAFTGDDD